MKTPYSRYLIIVPAVVLLLVGVASVAFAWGASSGGPSAAHAARPSGMPGNPRVGAVAGAPITGTVARKTDTAIVVRTAAGKTVTVNVSSTTRYLVRGVSTATLANFAVGDRVAVQGTLNADGSLNATLVQMATNLQPGTGGGGGRGFGGGSGRGNPGSGGRGGVPRPVPSGSGPTT